jgi:hypothetical protein
MWPVLNQLVVKESQHWEANRVDPFEDGLYVCANCAEIDAMIIRYKRIASQINDEMVQEGLASLVAKLLAEKASLPFRNLLKLDVRINCFTGDNSA